MKSLIFILSFVASILVGVTKDMGILNQDEDPIKEFFGIPFGKNKTDVKAAMRGKGFLPKEEKSDYIIYNDAVFLKKDVSIIFKFVDNEMYEGVVIFTPDLESRLVSLYNSIREDVSMKYGSGNSFENYDYPYKKGDGHYLTAIETGKARFNTYWGKSGSHPVTNVEYNIISLSITENLNVVMHYQDSNRVERVISNQKKSKLNDL